MKHVSTIYPHKKKRTGIKAAAVVLACALIVAGTVGALAFFQYREEKLAEEEANRIEAISAVHDHIVQVSQAARTKVEEEQQRIINQENEDEAKWTSEQEKVRQAKIEAARQKAIEAARQTAIEEARARYEEEIEAQRARRSSDFSDVILIGDSVMEYATAQLYSQLPGAMVNAEGGRSLETGPQGRNFDPNDGVLDHVRANAGAYSRYVIGTGNNEGAGMPYEAGEEIVELLGNNAEIYFVTQVTNANQTSMANTNASIAQLCENYDNVYPIDWNALAYPRLGELLLADGVHPTSAGVYEYAVLLREAITAYDPGPFDPSTVEFDPASVEFDPDSVEISPELTDAIMGTSLISVETLVALYKEHGVSYPSDVYAQAGAETIEEFCEACAEEAKKEGVRSEVLFAQAMHETAWLQFGNQVSVEQNNFGGIGALTSGGAGARFSSVQEGLRAQVQHLKAYASTEPLKEELVDPRFDLVERGCAPTVFDLGGRWAWPGDGYGDAIMAIMEDLYALEFAQTQNE